MEREVFERVWQRVQGAGGTAERQLREEAESAAFYGWLRRRCPSCSREAAALEAECRGTLSRLRFEYYLEHGENWTAPTLPPPHGGVLTELRGQYQRELTRSKSCTGPLQHSREKRAAILRQLLRRAMQ